MLDVNTIEEQHTRVHKTNELFQYAVQGNKLTWRQVNCMSSKYVCSELLLF